MFARIHETLKRISHVAVWISGAALMVSAIIVTVDVLLRKFVGWTMSGSDEVTSYVFAASTTWAYSYCLLTRSNIRIDALYNLLDSRPKAILDVIGLLLLLYYIYLLTANSFDMFLDNVEYDSSAQTTLATPLWIPQVFWLSGLCFFVLSLAFLSSYALTALARGDWATIDRIAGVKSMEEEISEETHI